METIMERVRKVLRKEFSPKEVILQNAGGGMVGGWIISNAFEDLTAEERQQKIWKLFATNLTEKDRERIVGFLTFTPLEKKTAFDDGSDDFAASSTRAKKPITARRNNGAMGRKKLRNSKHTLAAR